MVIIGEKINTINGGVAKALNSRDETFFQNLALSQVNSGIVDVIDINVGSSAEDEPDNMRWAVSCIEEVLGNRVRLAIDSSSPEAIIAGIEAVANKAGTFLNSITLEEARHRDLLPIAKQYDLNIIALPLDGTGIPQSPEQRLRLAEKVVELVKGQGISLSRLYIDCLVEPVSISCEAALVSLDTVRAVKQRIPEAKTFMCVSAVSFGLPNRKLINRNFLSLLLREGIDALILDPLDANLVRNLFASELLMGKDSYCQRYLGQFRKEQAK
jgi:5-methyltetrahydrofolate--homocysteine methyltransferase